MRVLQKSGCLIGTADDETRTDLQLGLGFRVCLGDQAGEQAGWQAGAQGFAAEGLSISERH